MNNLVRILIFAGFLGCAALILLGPAAMRRSGLKAGGEMPAQNMLPDIGMPMLVEFYSTTCGICQKMKPGMSDLENKYGKSVKFIYLDTDDPRNRSLTDDFQVYGLPSFFWITTDRKILDAREGGIPFEMIIERLEQLIEMHEESKSAEPRT